jgi:acyl-CoA reductase-like NAD-dependent aldehyde dehydrogenase
MPETTDRADRETPADIPPTLPEGMSRDAIKARETKLRDSGRQKTAENLRADDAATREVPLLKEEWRERAAAVSRSISGDEPVEMIEAHPSAPTEYVPPPAPSAPTKSAATVYELPVDDTVSQSVREAIDSARGAQPAWRALRFEQRVPFLDALRQELVDQRGDYVPSLATLSGRPMVEMLACEYMPVMEQLRSLPITVPPLLVERTAELANPLYPDTTMRLAPQPHGVVVAAVAFGPVFGQCMNLAIDAIATGNAVVLVCDEERPRIAEIMERMFERARIPRGLVRILTGGPRVMQALIDRRPDKFFYRGYTDHAAMLAQLCAMRGIEFSLGVSTKDILAVLETADPVEAARAACWTAFAGGGITGGSTERIVVHTRLYDEFRVAFIEAVRTMNSHHAQLADIRNTLDDQRVKELTTDAIAQGGRVTYPAGEAPGKWILWRPAIFEGLAINARLSTEQALAPICVLYRAEDVPYELRRLVGAAPAATLNVIGTPRKGEWDELMALNVGTITLNEPTIGPSAWMGSGPSGSIMNHSHCGPQHMLRVRQIVENDYGELGRVGFFPYTDDKAHALMDAMPAYYDTKAFVRARQRFNLIFRSDLRKLIERGG